MYARGTLGVERKALGLVGHKNSERNEKSGKKAVP